MCNKSTQRDLTHKRMNIYKVCVRKRIFAYHLFGKPKAKNNHITLFASSLFNLFYYTTDEKVYLLLKLMTMLYTLCRCLCLCHSLWWILPIVYTSYTRLSTYS